MLRVPSGSTRERVAADQGLPIILVGGFAQLGATSSVPRHRVDSNNQVIDSFSWSKGKHDIKFGFDYHRTTVQQYFDKYFRGRLKFEGHTATNGPVSVDTEALTDFLTGYVDSGFQYFGDSTRHTYENNFGIYAQDSYRITPRVTLNYGLRWDYFGVMGEKNDLLSNITSMSPAVSVAHLRRSYESSRVHAETSQDGGGRKRISRSGRHAGRLQSAASAGRW